jgi:hypothetical protein
MGGHFDAVGFGDPSLGFEATREHLRAAIKEGRRAAEADDVVYYELETPEGCGLAAATDQAGFLLNGCPYFRGQHVQPVLVESLAPWEMSEPDQGGARGRLLDRHGSLGLAVTFALPTFAALAAANRTGQQSINLVGLGYRARTHASSRTMRADGLPPTYLRPVGLERDLPPIRRCNVDCRGRIVSSAFLANTRTAARLAYALMDCGAVSLEVVLDLPSLEGGLAKGAYLEGSFWLVGRQVGGTKAE